MKKLSLSYAILTTLWLYSASVSAQIETYKIDNAHSFANFTIRHVASKTSGTFSDITGDMRIDRDALANSSVQAKINVFSVNTSNAKRDEHIKESKYLDAANYGEMIFVSTRVEAVGKDSGVIVGQFTLHGVTKEIKIPFKVLGFANDPWGGYRTGIEGHVSIKASDYGYGWATGPNAPVGDEIEVTLFIEGIKR